MSSNLYARIQELEDENEGLRWVLETARDFINANKDRSGLSTREMAAWIDETLAEVTGAKS